MDGDELRRFLGDDRIIVYERAEEPEAQMGGIVVHVSEQLVVVHQLSDDVLLDGFAALRPASIVSVEEDSFGDARRRVLAHRNERTENPLKVETLRELLARLGGEVVAIHDDDGDVCWVGEVAGVDDNNASFELISPGGEPRGSMVLELDEIRMVEWRTAYVEAVRIMRDTR